MFVRFKCINKSNSNIRNIRFSLTNKAGGGVKLPSWPGKYTVAVSVF